MVTTIVSDSRTTSNRKSLSCSTTTPLRKRQYERPGTSQSAAHAKGGGTGPNQLTDVWRELVVWSLSLDDELVRAPVAETRSPGGLASGASAVRLLAPKRQDLTRWGDYPGLAGPPTLL